MQESKTFKIRGYQTFRSDRIGRSKGGVMSLVRNNINATETSRYTEGDEYVAVKVVTNGRELHVVNVYCPQDKALSLDTIQIPDSDFIIAGDFNSQSQRRGYNSLDRRGEEIEHWQDEKNLILVNAPYDHPTFYSRSWHSTTTLDHAFCTGDVYRNIKREVGPQLGGSDHRPVLLTLTGDPEPTATQ